MRLPVWFQYANPVQKRGLLLKEKNLLQREPLLSVYNNHFQQDSSLPCIIHFKVKTRYSYKLSHKLKHLPKITYLIYNIRNLIIQNKLIFSAVSNESNTLFCYGRNKKFRNWRRHLDNPYSSMIPYIVRGTGLVELP